MQKLPIRFRKWIIDSPINYPDFTMNGGYTITMDYNESRRSYKNNYWVNVLDQLPIEYVDTGKINSENRDDWLFWVLEYDETKTSESKLQEISADIVMHFSKYSPEFLTNEKSKTFLRDFTNCSEVINADSTSTFTLRPESTDTMGNTTPAYTITL